ncbi:hypothetical protein [Pararhizobium gei]|uniref:hypothetical protein n=1 Tax=Pararhizobium gei TaxID=1395951 RepID=UPI0023D9CDB0|nr:hypothetical protein [Rhizobium gei]
MTDDRLDRFTMIGLHKLAAGVGDGLVPELYELLSRPMSLDRGGAVIAQFPRARARGAVRPEFVIAHACKDNILRFPDEATKRAGTNNRA